VNGDEGARDAGYPDREPNPEPPGGEPTRHFRFGDEGITNEIVDVTRERHEDKDAKTGAARTFWFPAVNNLGAFGRWAFVEVSDTESIPALRASLAPLLSQKEDNWRLGVPWTPYVILNSSPSENQKQSLTPRKLFSRWKAAPRDEFVRDDSRGMAFLVGKA